MILISYILIHLFAHNILYRICTLNNINYLEQYSPFVALLSRFNCLDTRHFKIAHYIFLFFYFIYLVFHSSHCMRVVLP